MRKNRIGEIIKGFEIIDIYYKKDCTIYVIKCCNCGNVQERRLSNFMNRKTKCECQKRSNEEKKLSCVYYAMINRCYNINNKGYKNYGGRGIKVCDEWKNKMEGKINFINWSLQNGYKEGLTLDRINNDKDYCPKNCRWVGRKIQNINRTRVHHIKYKDNYYTLKEFCKIKNVKYLNVTKKIKKKSLSEIFGENIEDNYIIRNDKNMTRL